MGNSRKKDSFPQGVGRHDAQIPEGGHERQVTAPEQGLVAQRIETMRQLDREIAALEGGAEAARQHTIPEEAAEAATGAQIAGIETGLGGPIGEEGREMITTNLVGEEAARHKQQEKALADRRETRDALLEQNREDRRRELAEAMEPFKDLQELLDSGYDGKRKILEDPGNRERFAEYRELLAEKLVLDIMPELEKVMPDLQYFVLKDVATEMPIENSKQILIAVVEPAPGADPAHTARTLIAEELIKRGLTNSVALGEKFSGNSASHDAFLDFVFIHRGENGEYQSMRPKHDIISEDERAVRIGKELPMGYNDQGTFREMSPRDFVPAPSYPEHFRDDIIYNGIYLQGPDMARKLDVFTNVGELTEAQRSLVAQGVMQEDHFFTPEQARQIKEARMADLRRAEAFGEKYFGGEMFDSASLAELAKSNPDDADLRHILPKETEAEIGKRVARLQLQPESIPRLGGLSKEKAGKLCGDLLKRFLFSDAGRSGKRLKNELFAYPDEVKTDIPITLLANSPRVMEAAKNAEAMLVEQGDTGDRTALLAELVEFMKGAIADFKQKDKEAYWRGHDRYKIVRPGF